jgi:hypothetical protein
MYEELISCFGTITFNDDGSFIFIQTVAASDITMQGILLTTRIGLKSEEFEIPTVIQLRWPDPLLTIGIGSHDHNIKPSPDNVEAHYFSRVRPVMYETLCEGNGLVKLNQHLLIKTPLLYRIRSWKKLFLLSSSVLFVEITVMGSYHSSKFSPN